MNDYKFTIICILSITLSNLWPLGYYWHYS